MTVDNRDVYYMEIALKEAMRGLEQGEVPVGAVAVMDNIILSVAHNSVIGLHDPSAHAEVLALKRAGKKIRNYRLNNVELYVTIEPCMMCAGAAINARIKRLIFGARDKKAGAITLFNVFEHNSVNHRVIVTPEVKKAEAAVIIKKFFLMKRGKLV